MTRLKLAAVVVALTIGAGCRGCSASGPDFPGSGSSGDAQPDDTGDTGRPDDTGDTGEGDDTGVQGFDDPGDVVSFAPEEDGQATVDLSDLSGDSNKDQEFYLVLVNKGSSALSFDLRYDDASGGSGGGDTGAGGDTGSAKKPAPAASPAQSRRLPADPFRARLREAIREGRLHRAAPAPQPALEEADVGREVREFKVRASLTDTTQYSTISARLWALGERVAIWVDEDQAIDWDYDCDGIIDEPDANDAYGFDNCDLQTIADIVDANIIPNVRSTFGEESDVNGDGLVNVVITPVLNAMTLGAEDEEDRTRPLESYADPEVDLNEYDPELNPYSNEQEVLFVFAPDPYGFSNPLARVTVEEYTSMALAAQIARAFARIVSYNQHVLVAGGDVEETWLIEGLGAMAADLTGFGAVYYDDAWDYLDAPHLAPLVVAEEDTAISSRTWGAQYLFLRWIVDNYGEGVLSSMVQTTSTGADNVAAAVGVPFDDLVLRWQVALLTTGVTDAGGDALVDPSEYPPFASATTISAPTSDPVEGDLYGANGYQQGINVGGVNTYVEGGTTDSPTENEELRVRLGHTDFLTMVTGIAFTGYVTGDYGAAVVRLTDLTLDSTALQIAADSADYYGAVIRWNDRGEDDFVVEQIFSATDASAVPLPDLPDDGSPIYAVGEITEPGATVIVDAGSATGKDMVPVYDTDRYLLDLSDRTGTVDIAVTLERHFEGSGDPAPFDPWLAVVPEEWLPNPTVDGTRRGECATGGVDFNYPYTVLEYLYYQVFLSPNAWSDQPFDACGEPAETETTCDEDWDRDGVLDEDEPRPQFFIQQVQVMQCTLAGNDPAGFEPAGADVIDEDEIDEDDQPSYDRANDAGGRVADSGEEAFIEISLDGGRRYVIVVGAGTDTGPYELTVRQIDGG